MNRRTFLAGAATGTTLALAGCIDSLVPGELRADGGTSVLHDAEEAFLTGGLSERDQYGFYGVIVGTEDETRVLTLPDGDPVAARVARTDWDDEFLLVMEARMPREKAFSLALDPGSLRQTNWSGMDVQLTMQAWSTPLPKEVEGAADLVVTAVFTFGRSGGPLPTRANVEILDDLYDPPLRTSLSVGRVGTG